MLHTPSQWIIVIGSTYWNMPTSTCQLRDHMIIYSSKWVWLLTVATPAAEGLQVVQQPIMTCPLAAHDLQGSHRNHTDGAQYTSYHWMPFPVEQQSA